MDGRHLFVARTHHIRAFHLPMSRDTKSPTEHIQILEPSYEILTSKMFGQVEQPDQKVLALRQINIRYEVGLNELLTFIVT